MNNKLEETQFVIYKNKEGNVSVDVILKDETIWITKKGMSELFECSADNIGLHLKNIYLEHELEKEATTEKFSVVRKEGNRQVKRTLEFYNLDAIIAVGYRVNSKKATQFRIWATNVLKEYMIKGFIIDKEKMKNGSSFGKDYFDELLETIKEIRLSERRQYQKITDIFESTSVDYNVESEEAYTFFKIVQNKLHYAITGKTAAELIYERVDANLEHMGLTNWKNSPDGKIYKYDIGIAKNYLQEDEIKGLERLTISFLDYAEDMAYENKVMTMNDWINATDELLTFRKKQVLEHSGKISHKQAMQKASEEYSKFRVRQDEEYISSMDEMLGQYLIENQKKK